MFRLNRLNRLIGLPRTNKVNNYYRYVNTNIKSNFCTNTTVHIPCNQRINKNNDKLVLIRKELEEIKKRISYNSTVISIITYKLVLIGKELDEIKKELDEIRKELNKI